MMSKLYGLVGYPQQKPQEDPKHPSDLNSIEAKNVKDQMYYIVGSALENLSLKDYESAFVGSVPYQRLRDEVKKLTKENQELKTEN